jgi:hypothetical protein
MDNQQPSPLYFLNHKGRCSQTKIAVGSLKGDTFELLKI